MTRVTVDAEMRSKLFGLGVPLELCDESGNVLGRLFPAVDMSEYERCEPPISEDELQRREHSSERRYTTAEVLRHLEQL